MHYGIIAAGEGSRLVQEGVTKPKPLVDLDGRPMVERLIDIFTQCGAESVSVIVNEQMTEVRSFLQGLALRLPVPLTLVVRSTPSSMHSFYELSRLMEGKGRFVLTTVDTIFRPEDFRRYVEAYAAAPARVDAMMALTSYIDDEKPLYVDCDPEMRITAFRDSADGRDRYVSGGIYGLSDRCIAVLRRCIETGVSRMRNYQRALLTDSLDVRGFDMGKIIDVDHAGDIETARRFIAGSPLK